jgi:hypothetical protein
MTNSNNSDPKRSLLLKLKRIWSNVVIAAKIVVGLAAIRTAAKFVWEALHTVGVL